MGGEPAMTELRAEALSPLDAATLWPQLHRLGTEVVAVRASENLLLRSGLAVTGLSRLPRMPQLAVLGVRRGLGFRGILAARRLAGGASWAIESIRLARDRDEAAVTALLLEAGIELARRGGRTVFLRCPEGSPHAGAIARCGFVRYTGEQLYAPPPGAEAAAETAFRPADRKDRNGVFRLYCRAVPESVRRNEALTQQEWRGLHGAFGGDREFVLERDGVIVGWLGVAHREARILLAEQGEGTEQAALALTEGTVGAEGTLVVPEYQPEIARAAEERGYLALGCREVSGRRLAMLRPIEEVAAVADTFPVAR